MNILITGATGFVGAALCSQQWPIDFTVYAVVRSEQSVALLPKNTLPVVVPSIDELAQKAELLSKIDCIIHLAARVHTMHETTSDPVTEFRIVNTIATKQLAKAAASFHVKRFIYLSTVKVYGESSTSHHSFCEIDPLTTNDPYGLSKKEAELLLVEISKQTDLEVVILRPPLIYGPGVKANFLQLLKIVKSEIPLPLAQIQNHRSLLFLGNLVDIITTCVTHPAASNEVFVISDGEDVSTSELLKLIALSFRCRSRLFYLPTILLKIIGQISGRTKQIERLLGSFSVNSEKIRNVLGWHPAYTMQQGILSTTNWYVETFEDIKNETIS